MENKGQKRLAVIRIRGTVNVNKDIEYTLRLLHLTKPNHLVLIDDRKSNLKMLHKIAAYVAWGEISLDTLESLLAKRARIVGNKPLTEEYLKKNSSFKSIKELTKNIFSLKTELKDIKDLKPVLRLHPPKKGLPGSKKRFVTAGGALGYHGEKINELIKKML